MKNKYYLIITFLCAVMLFFSDNVYAQESTILIDAVVYDDQGNPVRNAEVFSGSSYATTDASGRFTISIEPQSRLIVEARGFETINISSSAAERTSQINLVRAGFLYSREDMVNLGFREAFRGDVPGAIVSVDPTEIQKYDNNIWASDILTGRTLGLMGNNTIRGLGIGINVSSITGTGLRSGNALFIVDGLPREIDGIRASEIASITVLKDVNALALYGSAAVNGVILITTKRGEAFKTESRVTVNSGISTPHRFPQYLNASEYFVYNNIAHANDGRSEPWSDDDINNFRTGNPYRYPDIDYYSDEYLASHKNYTYVETEFSGGNDDAQYYTNLGWNSEGSLLNFGEGADARNNIFTARGNVDMRINDWIDAAIDGRALFVQDRSERGNYWSSAASIRPHEYTPLLPISLIDPENELLLGRKNDVNGEYLIGGNLVHQQTPFGDGYSGGVVEGIQRNFSFNNRVNFDLNSVTEGLSFHTNISFDYYIRYNQSILNQYSVYEPTWHADEDKIIGLNQRGLDARPGTQSVGNTFFRRRFGAYGQLAYNRVFDNVHNVSGSLIGFGSNFRQQGDYQGVKQAHLGVQLAYVFDRRYMVDFSGAYVNSVKLAEGNRGAFSPTLGLAWMISQEDFMSGASAIDMLKLRVSGGILNSDLPISGFYWYDESYGGSGSYPYFEGTRNRSGRRAHRTANPNLGFSQRKEITFGFEGLFFNQVFGVEANYFYNLYDKLISRPSTQYPGYYSDFIPYENFGSDMYQGAELGLTYNNTFGDFGISFGTNILYVTSERIDVDEFYANDYQYRSGHPRDATFGLEAVGFFRDWDDIASSPIQAFGDVRPGDIKYRDQNGDGIVDLNDEVFLRRWQHPWSAGVQLGLSYRNISLFVLGEGRTGSESFLEGNYYWVDGNNKYSEIVYDTWTPETHNSALYPRLTSVTNSNNHRRSSFWLYDNSYFQIRNIQLTYNMPESVTNALLMRDLSVFANVTNLTQFAPNREVRELNVGGEPRYATFSLGLRANF